LLALLLSAAAPLAAAQDLCSDYLSRINCVYKNRALHTGIDFGGRYGMVVISSTHGTVVRRLFNECAGPGLFVKTDIRARHEEVEGPVYAAYWHMEPDPELKPGHQLKPGDPIGTMIPLRHTRCHGSREHVHYELLVNGNGKRHINPHEFWVDGERKLTCYADGMTVPAGKAVVPRRC
jgi:murein DD-endopeptidase MepM/ murein hydrolase activator NlpD